MKQYMKTIILTCVITVFPMVIGLLLWNKMPDTVVTHWGAGNEANGWSSKVFAVFGMPILMTAVQFLCVVFTVNDPKKKNISHKMLTLVFWIIPVISWVCCLMIYGNAAGIKTDVGLITNLIIGVLFILIGNYIPKSKQSYTVGIKLPWTLDSEENWNRTSRLAGKLWIVGGLLFCVNAFFQMEAVLFAVILLLVLVPVVYSFTLYKRGI